MLPNQVRVSLGSLGDDSPAVIVLPACSQQVDPAELLLFGLLIFLIGDMEEWER
jgi:hypothetical protein